MEAPLLCCSFASLVVSGAVTSAICSMLLLGRNFQCSWSYSPLQTLNLWLTTDLAIGTLCMAEGYSLCFASSLLRYLEVASYKRSVFCGTLHGSREQVPTSQVVPTCDKYLRKTTQRREDPFLAHSFRGLCPWPAGSVAFRPVGRQNITVEGCVGAESLTS
jgi:hypothetical protein